MTPTQRSDVRGTVARAGAIVDGIGQPSRPVTSVLSVNDKSLPLALRERGVVIHSPLATVIQDVDPEKFEPGVEIFPGTTIRGRQTRFGAGTKVGKAGGGYFEDVQAGRDCDLFSGYFKDCVFLDGVTVRGHAEMRGGTLLEEGCEAAHHVGYKMTIQLPYVVAGSLVNFCDALMAGGTSRKDHSEIGSALALYNYSPWGDKWASLFGDVPRGVFCRSPRIFVGGQTQIVSPVQVGFGAVIPAGCAVRRDVPEGRIVGSGTLEIDQAFDAKRFGAILPKVKTTVRYLANLRGLLYWYRRVRMPIAQGDAFLTGLYQGAMRQVLAGITERIKRLDALVKRLPESLEEHEIARALAEDEGDDAAATRHRKRAREHRTFIERWPAFRETLMANPPDLKDDALDQIVKAFQSAKAVDESLTYIDFITQLLDDRRVEAGVAHLSEYVERLSVG